MNFKNNNILRSINTFCVCFLGYIFIRYNCPFLAFWFCLFALGIIWDSTIISIGDVDTTEEEEEEE